MQGHGTATLGCWCCMPNEDTSPAVRTPAGVQQRQQQLAQGACQHRHDRHRCKLQPPVVTVASTPCCCYSTPGTSGWLHCTETRRGGPPLLHASVILRQGYPAGHHARLPAIRKVATATRQCYPWAPLQVQQEGQLRVPASWPTRRVWFKQTPVIPHHCPRQAGDSHGSATPTPPCTSAGAAGTNELSHKHTSWYGLCAIATQTALSIHTHHIQA